MKNNYFLLFSNSYRNFLNYNRVNFFLSNRVISFFDIFFKDSSFYFSKKINMRYEIYQQSQSTNAILINYFDLFFLKFLFFRSYFIFFFVISIFFFSVFFSVISYFSVFLFYVFAFIFKFLNIIFFTLFFFLYNY